MKKGSKKKKNLTMDNIVQRIINMLKKKSDLLEHIFLSKFNY